MEAERSAERGKDGKPELSTAYADGRVDKLYKDMYEGNGKPSITVRMDRVERFVEKAGKLLTAILLLLVGALLTGAVDVYVRAHH